MSDDSIEVKLARIEERLVTQTHFLSDIVLEMREYRAKHESRISGLELWRSWIVGVGTAIASVISFLIAKDK